LHPDFESLADFFLPLVLGMQRWIALGNGEESGAFDGYVIQPFDLGRHLAQALLPEVLLSKNLVAGCRE
jgi:hypothetical protein